MDRAITEADCRTCGACCVAGYWLEPFVDVEAPDIARLSRGY